MATSAVFCSQPAED